MIELGLMSPWLLVSLTFLEMICIIWLFKQRTKLNIIAKEALELTLAVTNDKENKSSSVDYCIQPENMFGRRFLSAVVVTKAVKLTTSTIKILKLFINYILKKSSKIHQLWNPSTWLKCNPNLKYHALKSIKNYNWLNTCEPQYHITCLKPR